MSPFMEVVIACVAIIGGFCSFIYLAFSSMEKRLESKMDSVSTKVSRIADELREERRSKDDLYKFVNYKKGL